MIRFQCEQCAHKISVQDKHAGKRVKCSKCGSTGIVPAKSTIADFHCKSCGQKISVPQVHTGKKCKCPKCKNILIVPELESTSSISRQGDSEVPKITSQYSAYDLSLLDIPQKNKTQKLPISHTETSESSDEYEQEPEEDEEETAALRKLPWFVDIFLYPLSISGLVYLVICFCAPILISLIDQFLLQQVWPINEIIKATLYALFVGYVMYYLSWCIIDSTKGGWRAPDITQQSSPKGELVQCVGILLACIVFCFWPVAVYYILTAKTGLIYWLLSVIGLFFFPMALLSGFLHDSINGLNPALITKSVTKTFPRYFPIVIFFAGFFVLLGVVTPQFPQSKNFESILLYISELAGNIFGTRHAPRLTGFIYIAMIGAHILGRFYRKYQEKLNWEV